MGVGGGGGQRRLDGITITTISNSNPIVIVIVLLLLNVKQDVAQKYKGCSKQLDRVAQLPLRGKKIDGKSRYNSECHLSVILISVISLLEANTVIGTILVRYKILQFRKSDPDRSVQP